MPPYASSTSRRRRRGFTLMEVLVAIALILALFGAMFGFLYDMLSTRDRAIEFTAQQRAATMLLDRVEADLLSCIVGNEHHGAGVTGDEQSLAILSRSVGTVAEAGDEAALNDAFSDLQQSQYSFDPQTHQVSGSRALPGAESPRTHEFGARLYKVRFRYHDGVDWLMAFDSIDRDRLPLAVEVAVWFDPWPNEDWNELEDQDGSQSAAQPQRETFDMQGTFDEQEWAMRADRDASNIPMPDRVRVIAVPGGGEQRNAEDDMQ